MGFQSDAKISLKSYVHEKRPETSQSMVHGLCMQQLTYHNKYENPSKQSEIFHYCRSFDLNFYC